MSRLRDNWLVPSHMPRSIPEHARQRKTYSIDSRKRVIYQKYTLNKKIPEIILNLNISQHVVERTLQLWRDTGEVVSQGPGKKAKRRRVMIPDEIDVSSPFPWLSKLSAHSPFTPQFLITLIQQHPKMYLDEMQIQLLQKHGVIVGISTIWDTLMELGLSRKKVQCAPTPALHRCIH
jgi:transposase